MGPSCEYRTCTDHGFFHPDQGKCICREGYFGENCATCKSSPTPGMVYVCLEKKLPSQYEYPEFLLFAVSDRELGFYLGGTVNERWGDK